MQRNDGLRVVSRGDIPDVDPDYEDAEPAEYNWRPSSGERLDFDDRIKQQDPGVFRSAVLLGGAVAVAATTWGLVRIVELLVGKR